MVAFSERKSSGSLKLTADFTSFTTTLERAFARIREFANAIEMAKESKIAI